LVADNSCAECNFKDLHLCLPHSIPLSHSPSLSLSLSVSLSLSLSLSLPLSLTISLYRRLLDLLDSRAESSDSRLTTIRAKKFPGESFPPIISKPLSLIFPPPGLCTDNGVMVAWAGIEKINLGISDSIDGQVSRTDRQ
jgi:hypothetical protein